MCAWVQEKTGSHLGAGRQAHLCTARLIDGRALATAPLDVDIAL